jgi:hypothetical protein
MATNSGKLFAGTIPGWDTEGESMAKQMETKLIALMGPLPPGDPKGRRQMLIAIATGVIDHLQNNPGAIHVQVTVGGAAGSGSASSIEVQ